MVQDLRTIPVAIYEPGATVIIFNPKEKENALESPERVLGLVETGESRTPRPRKATQNILQA